MNRRVTGLRPLRGCLALLALGLAAAAPARSEVAFSNFEQPGDAYHTGASHVIKINQSAAQSFQPVLSGSLTSLRLALGSGPTITANLVISVRSGTDPNGPVLETWTLTQADVTPRGIKVLTSVVNPRLTAGTTYWLRLESSDATSGYNWHFANSAFGAFLSSDQGVTWVYDASRMAEVFEVNVASVPDAYQVRYFSNLAVGDSVINFTNSGASSTDAGIVVGGAQNGDICANVYAYSPDEQLVSCCVCNVTPNALNSLSVKDDLLPNTLTPIIPSALVVKVLATAGGSLCTPSSAATVTSVKLASGLLAWGSTIHALPVTPGTPAAMYGVAETAFAVPSQLSDAELTRMTQLCAFIRANGSGYGICKSCKVGGLGGDKK